MNYADYVNQLAALLVLPTDGDRFNTLLPWIISYAELSIYRDPDFDFLATRGPADTSSRTAQGSRYCPVPDGIIVVERVALILPTNTLKAVSGTRIGLLRASQAYIDLTWPEEAVTATPRNFQTYFAIRNQQSADSQFIIAPTPDAAYVAEVTGTVRPDPLSKDNPTTFLTNFFPDFFMAASMKIATGGLLKNFGAQSDNPQMAQSWATIYDELRRGAAVEAMRQRAVSSGWTSYPPASLAPLSRSAQPPPAQPAG